MSTLASIADKKSACGGAEANTGRLGCPVEFKTPKHLIGMKKGTVIPKETEWTVDYINLQTQAGLYIPLTEAEDFERLSSDDTMNANTSGVERLGLKGLPKYKLTFEEGNEFYRELSKLTSYKALDFAIGDEDGNWKLAKRTDGDYEGLSAGQVLAELTMEKETNGLAESKALIVQFLDRDQWDNGYKLFGASELGWKPRDIQGVNGVTLSYEAIPAATDTVLVVNAVLNADMISPVEGLVLADFLVMVNGATVVPTLVEESATIPGQYSITVVAISLNDVVVTDLFDSTLNLHNIISNGVLYRSDSISETAVA